MIRNTLILFIVLLNYLHGLCQSDSLIYKTYWTPRYGIGVQKNFFFELGISRLTLIDKKFGASLCFYSSIEGNVRSSQSASTFFYAAKVGVENSGNLLMSAIELKYISDFISNRLVLTPKVGISLVGVVNLLYGYNFLNSIADFDGIGHHQFLISVNISKKLIQENW